MANDPSSISFKYCTGAGESGYLKMLIRGAKADKQVT